MKRKNLVHKLGLAVTIFLGGLAAKKVHGVAIGQYVYWDSVPCGAGTTTVYNQDNTDSMKVEFYEWPEHMKKCEWWAELPPSWNIVAGDSGWAVVKDTSERSSNIKYHIPIMGSNLQPPIFPGTKTASAKVSGTKSKSDPIRAISYKLIGGLPGPDTLERKFPPGEGLHFPVSKIGVGIGDEYRIEAWTSGGYGSTEAVFNGAFGDADTMPPITIVPVEEKEVNSKGNSEYKVSPNPFINGAIIYKKGIFTAEIYDVSGRKIQTIEGKDQVKIGKGFKSGVYFTKLKNRFGNKVKKKLIKLR